MSLPVFVPDASVILKWVLRFKEDSAEKALLLRNAFLAEKCRLVVPSLWFFEVGNILGIKEPHLAEALLGALLELSLEEQDPGPILHISFELMETLRVTFYDAAYHATAIRREGILITADDVYFRKAAPRGHVIRLRDWHQT